MHSSFFRGKESRQTDGQRDMRAASSAAATLGQAGAKKVNATKSGDKRRKTQEQRDVHGDRVHAPDILMVSDLIEMDAPFVPSFFVSCSLSAENICAAQITRGEST